LYRHIQGLFDCINHPGNHSGPGHNASERGHGFNGTVELVTDLVHGSLHCRPIFENRIFSCFHIVLKAAMLALKSTLRLPTGCAAILLPPSVYIFSHGCFSPHTAPAKGSPRPAIVSFSRRYAGSRIGTYRRCGYRYRTYPCSLLPAMGISVRETAFVGNAFMTKIFQSVSNFPIPHQTPCAKYPLSLS